MIDAALAQMRFAASLTLGVPFSVRSLDRLIIALQATRHEFGTTGPGGRDLLQGPALDEETRREMQLRRFRTQAQRAVRETAYYQGLLTRLACDPARLRYEDIGHLPLTPKEAIRDTPDAFVRRTARPVFRTTTTGTTGRPTRVAFSAYEMAVYVALGAISHLFEGHIGSEDIVQISTSARATLGNTCFAGACARVGALVFLGGLVSPAESLAALAEPYAIPGKHARVSVLCTYPSYLGELIETGLQLGYRPADFGLRRIHVGGEVVTAGLKARCQDLFGLVTFVEGYAQTETWPVSATRCEHGHLHFEPSQGLVEVIDPDTGKPATPGALGTLVVTPLPPYRDTTLVLRYHTEDMVRVLSGPLTCPLRHLPAVSNVQGKLRLAVRHAAGWTCPRDLLEALEALPEVPLPARCGFWAVPGGVAVEVVARADSAAIRRVIGESLEAAGVPLRELHLVTDPAALRQPYPARGSLRELSFAGPRPASVVAA
jgi:phenylacetate-coenzyme A ligase PaaK-like adenylate-forming protein